MPAANQRKKGSKSVNRSRESFKAGDERLNKSVNSRTKNNMGNLRRSESTKNRGKYQDRIKPTKGGVKKKDQSRIK